MNITQNQLKDILHYEPSTGEFTWLISCGPNKAGSIAGAVHHQGYIRIGVNKKYYQAHRLAWLYVHGVLPKDQIDHINGIRNDNRISNLRECNNLENQQNCGVYKNNKSGYTGVFYRKDIKKWLAKINFNSKQMYLGYYDTPEKAHDAYCDAKNKYHTFNPAVR
jgi:hypothetical protein